MNPKGDTVIPFEYDYVSIDGYLVNSSYRVEKNGKWGFIGEKGESLTPITYDKSIIYFVNSSLFSCSLNGKIGLMNKAGQVVLPPIYDDINVVGNDKLQVEKDGETFLIDLCGKRLPD